MLWTVTGVSDNFLIFWTALLGQAGGQSAVNQIDSPRLKYSSLFTLQYKNIILRSNINTSYSDYRFRIKTQSDKYQYGKIG